MANTTTSVPGNKVLFSPELVAEMFNKVKGHSALAKLCATKPMPFSGIDMFTFSMDGEAAIVGEGAAKPAGEAAWGKVTIAPIKFVYQHRVTDEFVNLAKEKQLPYLQAFADGFAKKIARALDIAGFHGVNPADGKESSIVGSNCFDKAVTNTIDFDDTTPPDDTIDAASAVIIAEDGTVSGVAMSPAFGSALGAMKVLDSRLPVYPEYRFGGNPGSFAGMAADVNNTVAFGGSNDLAIVGDFVGAFRWGYADNIPLEIIPYGDPDGLGDLKHSNQIVLRSEAYIGWGILDAKSFARIVKKAN